MGRHADPGSDEPEASERECGLEAFSSSDAIRDSFVAHDSHDPNDHVALLYETQEEQFAAAVPFVRRGLERGERCLYVADENTRAEILEAMQSRGIDVDAALESGALSVHTKEETYLRNGSFDPDEMIAFLEGTIAEVTAEYGSLRITGEMTWALGDQPDVEDLVRYECRLNELYPDVDLIGLCQYNRDRFPPEVVRDVIRTHPHLVRDDWVSHNVYYTPPEQFFETGEPGKEVEQIEATLADLAEAQTERKRQNERLEEFASLVAHDLRTPLSVATGRLELARKEHHCEHLDDVARRLDQMDELIGDLLSLARGGRTDVELESVDLTAIAERCWRNVPTENATLLLETEETIRADYNRLQQLIDNLLGNAVDHGDEDVTITIGHLDDGFYVADDGPGIPPDERERVFEAGYSTTHDGTGFGLRIVEEVADAHGWEVTLADSESGGARFEIVGTEDGRSAVPQ